MTFVNCAKAFIILLLASNSALADEVYVNYGVGLAESAVNSVVETKMVDLGERHYLLGGLYWQNRVGFWGDGSGNPDRKSSFYGSSGLGVEADLNPVEIRSGWGLAVISTPDGYLGGSFPQFNGNLGVDLRDKSGAAIGLEYSHVSSAGVLSPNKGRDFLTIELSQKF